MFVIMKDSYSLRMCIYYHTFNKVLIKNKQPLSRIDDIIDQLQGSTSFAKIDLRFGHHQLRGTECDILKITFTTQYVHYEFFIMSFGLSNVSASFMDPIYRVIKPSIHLFRSYVTINLDNTYNLLPKIFLGMILNSSLNFYVLVTITLATLLSMFFSGIGYTYKRCHII